MNYSIVKLNGAYTIQIRELSDAKTMTKILKILEKVNSVSEELLPVEKEAILLFRSGEKLDAIKVYLNSSLGRPAGKGLKEAKEEANFWEKYKNVKL